MHGHATHQTMQTTALNKKDSNVFRNFKISLFPSVNLFEKSLDHLLSVLSSLFPAELQWWHGWVAEGSQSCPASSVTQRCCMFPYAPKETRSQYLQAYTHVLTHTEEQEVQRRLNLKMCVVRLEVCMSLWREGKRVVGDQAARM